MKVKCGYCGTLLAEYNRAPKQHEIVHARDFTQKHKDWKIVYGERVLPCPACKKTLEKFEINDDKILVWSR